MIAIAIALLVDWDEVWAATRRAPSQTPTEPGRPAVTVAP
jgi:hypothetical protein